MELLFPILLCLLLALAWWPWCCCVKCMHCIDGKFPQQIQVTIAGLTDPGDCPGCVALNDIYVLDWTTDTVAGGYCGNDYAGYRPAICLWVYEFPAGSPCGATWLTVQLSESGGNLVLYVLLTNADDRGQQFRYAFGSGDDIDCLAINVVAPPFYALFCMSFCQSTGATATIVAL